EAITALVKTYFQDVQLCLMTAEYTTAWQHLEVGIMAGCTISTLAFTMAIRSSSEHHGMHHATAEKTAGEHRVNPDEDKAKQVQSISISKRRLLDQRFHVGDESIPTVTEKPVKSLGCWYNATLKDTDQVD
ncbi:hypothetical protein LDENG_00286300, partial [Lucifuga dentata]